MEFVLDHESDSLSFGTQQNLGSASHESSQIHGQFEVLGCRNASNSRNFSLLLSPKRRLDLNPPIELLLRWGGPVGQFTVLVQVCGSLGEAWALPLALLNQGVGTWAYHLTCKTKIKLLEGVLHPISMEAGRQCTMCTLVTKKLQVKHNLGVTRVTL